jgi:hypothetical protein
MQQLPRNSELDLHIALRNSTGLKYLGCRFDRGLVGSITVNVSGHALGAWWDDAGNYCFSTVAYRPTTTKVQSVKEAIATTQLRASSQIARTTDTENI